MSYSVLLEMGYIARKLILHVIKSIIFGVEFIDCCITVFVARVLFIGELLGLNGKMSYLSLV